MKRQLTPVQKQRRQAEQRLEEELSSAAELRAILKRHPNLSMITTRSGRDAPGKKAQEAGEIPPSPPFTGGLKAVSLGHS